MFPSHTFAKSFHSSLGSSLGWGIGGTAAIIIGGTTLSLLDYMFHKECRFVPLTSCPLQEDREDVQIEEKQKVKEDVDDKKKVDIDSAEETDLSEHPFQ